MDAHLEEREELIGIQAARREEHVRLLPENERREAGTDRTTHRRRGAEQAAEEVKGRGRPEDFPEGCAQVIRLR